MSDGPKSKYFRTNLTLPKSLDTFLENMGAEARSLGGRKLAKTEVIRSLIRFLAGLKVDLSGVKDEDELLVRLKQAVKEKRRK